MKKLSTKTFSPSIILLFLNMFFLEGCQKEMQINNSVGANVNLDLTKSKIIYTDVNPDVTRISNSTSSQTYNLDLNNDDTTDFVIAAFFMHYYYNSNRGVMIKPFKKNRVACDSLSLPLALNLDDLISSNLNWVGKLNVYGLKLRAVHYPGYQWAGNWTDSTDHYVGLKIKQGSNTYYGWVRLSVSVSPSPPLQSSVIIKDYAYNGIPNKRILPGQMK